MLFAILSSELLKCDLASLIRFFELTTVLYIESRFFLSWVAYAVELRQLEELLHLGLLEVDELLEHPVGLFFSLDESPVRLEQLPSSSHTSFMSPLLIICKMYSDGSKLSA